MGRNPKYTEVEDKLQNNMYCMTLFLLNVTITYMNMLVAWKYLDKYTLKNGNSGD